MFFPVYGHTRVPSFSPHSMTTTPSLAFIGQPPVVIFPDPSSDSSMSPQFSFKSLISHVCLGNTVSNSQPPTYVSLQEMAVAIPASLSLFPMALPPVSFWGSSRFFDPLTARPAFIWLAESLRDDTEAREALASPVKLKGLLLYCTVPF